ncbi:MAG: hypothetical protein QME68_03455 [Elusimicrobiota bacterium]|nr:hypothetical protein [Elusimicrobiota bacterium]
MLNKVSKEKIQLLKLIGSEANKIALEAYLVGGIVRDLLLGKPNSNNYNFDIALESHNKENVLRTFINNLRSKIHISDCTYYNQFLTATVRLNAPIREIDFAITRSEKYIKLGALPEVKPADIISDLYRRDFTINSMAISISPNTFGKLLDPTDGLKDIKQKYIRVLHRKSFVDDPTRILRAIRFATRLSFKLEPETEKLLKDALKKNYLKKISQERLTNELLLSLKERGEITAKCLKEFSLYGIEFFDEKIPDEKLNLLSHKLTTKFPVETKLSILLYSLIPSEISHHKRVLRRQHESPTWWTPEEIKLKLKKLKLKRKLTNEIYDVFRFISGKVGGKKLLKVLPEWSSDFFKIIQFNQKRVFISGNDLIRLGFKPGPIFKEIIQTVNTNQKLNSWVEIKKYIFNHWKK